MSLVFVSPGGMHGGGGMGTVTRSIVTDLRRRSRGTPVKVLDPRGDGSVLLSPIYTLAALGGLVAEHLHYGIDVLHLNVSERLSVPRKALFLLYGRLFGIPVVMHHHGAEFIPEFDKRSGFYRRLVTWAARSADCNIVLGEDWYRFLHDRLGVPPDRLRLMYNAVAGPQVPPPPGLRAEGPVRLLMLANLSPRKGVGELLEAMRGLRERGRDVELTLAGGGEVARYRDMAQALGIAGQCRFTGWLKAEEATALLEAADVFVLPSHNEGLPMAILEALSRQVAVVATPVGAIPEVLSDGRDCLLVPPGDVQALKGALDRLITNEQERTCIAVAGRWLFEQRFELGRYVDDLLSLYEGLRPPGRHQEERA
jgi:glycosyltransferase involved in cell wall biosynthesis